MQIKVSIQQEEIIALNKNLPIKNSFKIYKPKVIRTEKDRKKKHDDIWVTFNTSLTD